jgi:hypothetical protein
MNLLNVAAMKLPETTIIVTRPNWLKSEYQFSSGGVNIGEAKLTGSMRPGAAASLLEQNWSLKQTGFWKPAFEFKSEHRPFTKGKLTPTFGGKISWTASDGKTYTFRKTKWYSSNWAWYDESNILVIEVKPVYSFNKKNALITVAAPKHPDLAFLIFIGWFSMITQQRNAAAAAS